MNIIIVGCGKVGTTLADQLNEEGNNITVIDERADKIEDLSARYDIMGVVGNGAIHTVQEKAGINGADLLIAVTGSDELNLLCCLIAKKAGNCQTIARIKNPAFSSEAPFLKDELGLAMVINPEQAAADEIARVLRFPSAIKIDTFAKGRVELMKFRLPEGSRLAGMSVWEVISKLKCDILFCTVERGDEAHITNGNFIFAERDVVSLIAAPDKALDFFKKIDYNLRSVKDVMIAGGGDTAYYLCDRLHRTGSHMRIKLIEKDLARCKELSQRWPDTVVIHGDATNQDLLIEERIADASSFVALTGIDEENILLSLFAKRKGPAKVVTKINRMDFDDVIKHLDLDCTVYPKNITADIIMRYVRAMKNSRGSNMETLYNIIRGKVEAAEFVVKNGSPMAGTPLMQLSLKPDVLIAAIIHKGKVIIPRGHDTIQPGDGVVVVTKLKGLHDLCDVLK